MGEWPVLPQLAPVLPANLWEPILWANDWAAANHYNSASHSPGAL